MAGRAADAGSGTLEPWQRAGVSLQSCGGSWCPALAQRALSTLREHWWHSWHHQKLWQTQLCQLLLSSGAETELREPQNHQGWIKPEKVSPGCV